MSHLATLTQVGHGAACVPEMGDVRDTPTHLPNQFQRMYVSSMLIVSLCAEMMQGASNDPQLVLSHDTWQ